MKIGAPTLPLGTHAFVTALRRGHGRALQQLEEYGAHGVEDAIVAACLSCVVFDPQSEASRAPWLCSLVELAKLNESVVQLIEAADQELTSENHWDMEQRCAVLKELAVLGSANAKRVLYSSLARSSNTASVVGGDAIIALDGVDGLKHVARQLGRWLQEDPQFWVDDYIIEQFDESAGDERGLAILEGEAAVDSNIARYLAGTRATRASQSGFSSRSDMMALSGLEIVAKVENNPRDHCHWLRRWGAQAGSDERETVFAALLASGQPEHVKRLFRCFAKTGVPRFDHRLLPWLTHSDTQLRWVALRALAPVAHPELRQLAKRFIAEGNVANGVTLLVNNFEANDFSMCSDHLTKLDNADAAHDLVGELLDLCEAHPGSEALDCLLYVYEHSPCSSFRTRAVKALRDTDIAPAWVLAEAAFDADPETRSLVTADRCAAQCAGSVQVS